MPVLQLPKQQTIATTTVVKLRVPQIRVLQALAQLTAGGLTRATLSEIIGNKTGVVVGRAVGYSDPAKRTAFEQTKDGGGSPGNPCPSLLTLGLVEEKEVDKDGLAVAVVSITELGRQTLSSLGTIDLPPIRDSYEDYRNSKDRADPIPLLPY